MVVICYHQDREHFRRCLKWAVVRSISRFTAVFSSVFSLFCSLCLGLLYNTKHPLVFVHCTLSDQYHIVKFMYLKHCQMHFHNMLFNTLVKSMVKGIRIWLMFLPLLLTVLLVAYENKTLTKKKKEEEAWVISYTRHYSDYFFLTSCLYLDQQVKVEGVFMHSKLIHLNQRVFRTRYNI